MALLKAIQIFKPTGNGILFLMYNLRVIVYTTLLPLVSEGFVAPNSFTLTMILIIHMMPN